MMGGIMKGLLIFCLLFSGPVMARDLDAVTDWGQRVTLSTPVSGMIGHVNVSVGEQVSRGNVLIELDQRLYQTRLAAAESQVEATSQEKDEARRELDRSLELYDRTMLSDHERKLAEIEAARTDAAFRKADAELARIRINREYSRITAPFDGIVEQIFVQTGQAVINRTQATPLLSLCESGHMKVVSRIEEKLAAELKLGASVQIGVRGQWVEGRLSLIGLQPVERDANGAKYTLEAVFDLPENLQLRAGEKAVLRLQDE
ncbi:MAG: efflux RND transporter periplasmic adaptor subunit [Candidatus Thiodiazotropha sp.]|jgi:RND family efflux transporter MFP subunit